jgi:hypothetical protein
MKVLKNGLGCHVAAFLAKMKLCFVLATEGRHCETPLGGVAVQLPVQRIAVVCNGLPWMLRILVMTKLRFVKNDGSKLGKRREILRGNGRSE